jgi:hypothetical protein
LVVQYRDARCGPEYGLAEGSNAQVIVDLDRSSSTSMALARLSMMGATLSEVKHSAEASRPFPC